MLINIGAVIAALRKFFGFEMAIAEWIGTAILVAVPYLVIGMIWALTHTNGLAGLTGTDRTASFLGSVVSWPVLLFSDVCMS